jgi:hypothetical protein
VINQRVVIPWLCALLLGCSGGSGTGGKQGSGGATAGTGGGSGGGGGATDGGSGGTSGSGGASATGGTGADAGTDAGVPIILSLATNVTTLYPSTTLIVTAVVTHPQGINQIIGGTLDDPSGASYGAFIVSTTSGSYSITLTWNAIQQVQATTTGAGGGPRMFVVTFYDQSGHSTSKSFSIQLACPTTTDAICAGSCTSLQTLGNCGACGRNCATVLPSTTSMSLCSNQGQCGLLVFTLTLQSCTAACQAMSLTCTGTSTVEYELGPGGATTPPMTIDCSTVPASTTTYQGLSYSYLNNKCQCYQ